MRRHAVFYLLTLLVVFLTASNAAEAGASRLRYFGSSNIAMPTGYMLGATTYISDGGHNTVMYTQPFMGCFMEASLLRHMNDSEEGKNIFNFKLNIFEEDTWIPNIVWGVGDAGMSLGSRLFYFAGSKTFDAFAATVHGGFFKDPVSTEKKSFFGAEKTILPLVILAAERVDGVNSVGIKMRPYPGVSIEYARRGDGTDEEATLYKLQYIKAF